MTDETIVPKKERNKGGRPKKVMPVAIEATEVTTKVVEATVETVVTQRERRRKPGHKRLGRLANIPQIPGYFTYLAIDGESHRAGNIRSMTVDDDYEFVRSEEIDQRDAQGNPVVNTVVTFEGGINEHGQKTTHYLLKKPIDYYMKDKIEEANANMQKVDESLMKTQSLKSPDAGKDPKAEAEFQETLRQMNLQMIKVST